MRVNDEMTRKALKKTFRQSTNTRRSSETTRGGVQRPYHHEHGHQPTLGKIYVFPAIKMRAFQPAVLPTLGKNSLFSETFSGKDFLPSPAIKMAKTYFGGRLSLPVGISPTRLLVEFNPLWGRTLSADLPSGISPTPTSGKGLFLPVGMSRTWLLDEFNPLRGRTLFVE